MEKITDKQFKMSMKCLELQIKEIEKRIKELEKIDMNQILKEELTREQDYYE